MELTRICSKKSVSKLEFGKYEYKKMMKTAGQVIVNVLAGIALAVLLVLQAIAKNAKFLILVGVIAILVMLCRG